MPKKSYPLAKVYGLLEPGPVVLLTTAAAGRANVMTMSWHAMLEFEPPLLSCVVSNRNYSFDLLMATRECVINIPTAEIAEQVVQCGNVSGATVDKFLQCGLTPVAAKMVSAPLIAECYASLECRVVDIGRVKKYGQFVLEVVKAWRDPAVTAPRTLHHLGYGKFMVAGDIIQLKSSMR
ncbi:MAG: flavin reductase family protein [Burkholderiaceae bacterium]|nr:flavin reductase family protein [Burkholderiaceae bacterium]